MKTSMTITKTEAKMLVEVWHDHMNILPEFYETLVDDIVNEFPEFRGLR